MKTIHKYKVPVDDVSVIKMPSNAEILSVQARDGDIYVWAKVDTEKDLVNQSFFVYGTGEPINNIGQQYLDTVQIGSLVWHVYLGC